MIQFRPLPKRSSSGFEAIAQLEAIREELAHENMQPTKGSAIE